MNHLIPVIAIAVSAAAVGFFVSPADPISHIFATTAILSIALPAYWIGVRRGSKRA